MEEIWKDIAGYENLYMVSNLGRVKSLTRWHGRTDIILKSHDFMGTYQRVVLADNNRNYTGKSVHRLVATAFLPNPDDFPDVNHKDENPANNTVDNLEWCTHKYNQNYGTRTQRAILGESVPVIQFSLEGNFIREWISATEAGRSFGGSDNGVRNCCNGNDRMAYGYMWRWRKDFGEIPTHIEYDYVPAKIQSKIVLQFTLDGKFVKEYSSALEAAKMNGYSRGNISNVCRGIKPYMYSYIWRYKEDSRPVVTVIPQVKSHKRPVLQFSLNNKFIREYQSSPAAARETGGNPQNIFRCCNGGRNTYNGYIWKFKDYCTEKEVS